MVQRGSVIENPLLGLRLIVTETDAETGGMGYAVEWFIQPACGRDPDHIHERWDETFDLISGTAHYLVDGVAGVMQAGDQLHIPPHTPHTNPWNSGTTVLQMRQTIRFADADPARIQALLGAMATIHGLARDGKANRHGMPNLLQFAVSFRTLIIHGNYFTKVPVALQRFLFAALATLGRLVGYQATYPRYTAPTGSE